MKNKFTFLISILALMLLISGCAQKGAEAPAGENKGAGANVEEKVAAPDVNAMVDCSKADDPMCFIKRMNQCLPVTVNMMGNDNATTIEITVLGQVNDTCHFQRKINNALNLDCYFPKGTLNAETLDQTFGNDKGLQKVVDDNCHQAGW
jgi:PBP1b-binding outer membrane lipoprotein LpoB